MEFSLALVPSITTGEVHGLEREFPDVDIAEITGWSIRSRARSAKSSVDQLGAASKAEPWGLDTMVGGVDLGPLVNLTSLVIMWTGRLHWSDSWVFEPIMGRSPL